MLTTVLFLATLNKALVDYLAEPARRRYPDHDFWWLIYIALATGIVIGWLADVNVLAEYIGNPLAGRILTSVLIGGGSSLLHSLFEGTVMALNKPRVLEVKDGGE